VGEDGGCCRRRRFQSGGFAECEGLALGEGLRQAKVRLAAAEELATCEEFAGGGDTLELSLSTLAKIRFLRGRC
jgi:hypothetical protein